MSLSLRLITSSVLCIMLATTLYPLNIAKLKLHGVIIDNPTSEDVIVTVTSQSACTTCKDTCARQQQDHVIPAHETITIHEPSWMIHDLTLDANRTYALFMGDIQQPHKFTVIIRPSEVSPDVSFDNNHRFMELMALYNHQQLLDECLLNQRPAYNVFLPSPFTSNDILSYFAQLHNTSTKSCTTSPIPQIIHQNWFGITGDMPVLYQKWRREWRKYHPGWKYICWNYAMIEKAFPKKLFNQALFDAEACRPKKNYAKMSDIVRYEILKKFGGLYVDSDTRCFESFNNLHHAFDFYLNLEPLSEHYFLTANFLIASTPKHPILKACCKEIKRRFLQRTVTDSGLHAGDQVLASTGPGVLFWAVLAGLTEQSCVLPNAYFSSFYHDHDVHNRPLSPYAYCIHDFACLKLKSKHHWSFALAS